MNILLIANKVPYPPKDGGAFATLNMALGLCNNGINVTVVAISTPKHPFTEMEVPPEIQDKIRIHSTFVDTKISSLSALKNLLFSQTPYNAERFISKHFELLVGQILLKNEFDIIQLEGLYLAPYIEKIRKLSKAPIALRAHNVEWEIWQRAAKNEGNPLKRIYLRILARRIKRMETNALQKIDLLVPISMRDEKILCDMGFSGETKVCPTGYDLQKLVKLESEVEFPSIFHLGGLDWIPNKEGLLWFLENCWDKILEKVPGTKFYVAGRNASGELIQKFSTYSNLVFLGEVPDSTEFMLSKAVMVVPLLSGSGMRIKIVEGMALGKAIVSTSVGAEGIDAEDGKEICIANSDNDFISRTAELLLNRSKCEELGKNASIFAQQNLDNNLHVKQLVEFYSEYLRSKK